MGKYLHMILILTVIALVSGLALGGLNELTFEQIENNILKFKKIPAVVRIYEAVSGALEDAQRASIEEELLAERKLVDLGGEEPLLLFVVKKEGRPYAAAIENFGLGFGGSLGVMVGFELETGDVVGIGVTTLAETPGVGTRVTEESFTLQFRGLPGDTVFKVKKDGGDIDGISGATISSRAVAEAIARANAFFQEHREKILEAVKE